MRQEQTKLTVTVPYKLKEYIKQTSQNHDATMSEYTVELIEIGIKAKQKQEALEALRNIKKYKVIEPSENILHAIRKEG
jgi:hypothetical protein